MVSRRSPRCVHEDGELRPSLNATRLKARNLRARPQCSLQLLDIANPDRYLEVRGLARIESDAEYEFANRLPAKYGGIDLRNIERPGESRMAVTIEPVNVYAVDVGWVLDGGPRRTPEPRSGVAVVTVSRDRRRQTRRRDFGSRGADMVPSVSDARREAEQKAREAFSERDWDRVVMAVGSGDSSGAPESRRLRGWALYHLGRYAEALDDFSEVLRSEPSSTDAALGRGRCYRMLGRVDDAAGEFSLAHRLSPTDPHPLCERGAVLILDERWDEALADYKAAEALDPNHPGLASYFAELYLYSGRPGDALIAAQRGLECEPDSVMHRVNLAHALLFTGKQDEAIAEYRAVQGRISRGEHVSGAAIALNDLALMREAGLTCDGIDEVESMLRHARTS